MKEVLFVLGVVLLFGCEREYKGNEIHARDNYNNSLYSCIYIIDSCEYIGGASVMSHAFYLTHKGNCKFCNNKFK